jgi:hypothetical protein
MQQVINDLNTTYSYFTVSQWPLGNLHIGMNLKLPSELDLYVFSSGGDSSPMKSAAVPLLKEELHPVGLTKMIPVSFQGALYTDPVRTMLFDIFNTTYLFLDVCDNWKLVLESSIYALCPRGYRPSSFRLYEALQLGTIPIIVWDETKWLPYEEMIDWSSFAVVVQKEDMSNIPNILAQKNVSELQENLAKVKHMFTYQYVLQYIINRVQKL